jgi:hypothetical protein
MVLGAGEGPNTDLINERIDGIDFFENGLVELAKAWNTKLDFNFFSNANSILPSSPLIFD